MGERGEGRMGKKIKGIYGACSERGSDMMADTTPDLQEARISSAEGNCLLRKTPSTSQILLRKGFLGGVGAKGLGCQQHLPRRPSLGCRHPVPRAPPAQKAIRLACLSSAETDLSLQVPAVCGQNRAGKTRRKRMESLRLEGHLPQEADPPLPQGTESPEALLLSRVQPAHLRAQALTGSMLPASSWPDLS